MKNRKRILTIALTGAIILGSSFGVAAATNNFRSHGLLRINNDEIIVDADAIGYWIEDASALRCDKYDAGNNVNPTIIIRDRDIESDSLVDIYYSNDCITAVANAEPKYEQTDGQITITFVRPVKLTSDVSIDSVHVTNPVNTATK